MQFLLRVSDEWKERTNERKEKITMYNIICVDVQRAIAMNDLNYGLLPGQR